jgi:hypothetical protein
MSAPTTAARLLGLSLLGSITLLGAQVPAHADSYVINFDKPYNGDVPSTPPRIPATLVGPGNPGLIATFTDTIANQVQLELRGNLLIEEYFDGLAFNLAPSILPSALSVFSCSAPGTICDNYSSTFPATQNSFILQGNGNGNGFDFGFEFANPNSQEGSQRFNGTETVRLLINGPGITAQSFAYVNTPSGQGSDYVGYGGAKVNGIPGGGSGAIGTNGNGTTSAPGPLPILGAAAAFGCSRRIRTRIRSSRQPATIS